MWELDCEESWAPKNWCFWTVVLENTLESPLDCKETQTVHSEGDQSWDFFGRNDAKAETPVLWPPHAKSWLIRKDSDSGRDWRQEEKGTTEDEMAGWHHWLDGRESEWTPGVYSNSCPLSRWCHPTISFSVVPFSSHLRCFPASGSFQMSQLFASGGQSIGVSASASVFPMNIQDWFPLGMVLLDLLAVQGTLKSLLQDHSSKASILRCSALFIVQLSLPYTTTEKTRALTRWTLVGKETSLPFNMLSRLVITFLPRSKCLLISWLQSPSAVILEPLQNKVCHCFHCFPTYLPWSDGTRYYDLSFLNVKI